MWPVFSNKIKIFPQFLSQNTQLQFFSNRVSRIKLSKFSAELDMNDFLNVPVAFLLHFVSYFIKNVVANFILIELDAKNNVIYREILVNSISLEVWFSVIFNRLYILFFYISGLGNLKATTNSPLNYTRGVVFPFFHCMNKKGVFNILTTGVIKKNIVHSLEIILIKSNFVI